MQAAQHLDQFESSYIREILDAAGARGVISLAGGLPCAKEFPLPLMEDSLAALARQPALFQYGSSSGHGPLLECLREQWRLPADDKLLICNGSQQALDLVARAFIDPGDGVAMEAPCYLGALQVFSLAGARIELVAQHTGGPDLDQLEALFSRGAVKLFYAVPDFHNPTGRCWALSTRQRVARLCEQYRVTLVEDAPYRELRFSGQELPRVSSLCPGRALLLRSFSKIAAPGLRLGAVSGPAHWVASLVKVKQAADLHTNVPLQELMFRLLSHPDFPAHLDRVRTTYRKRCEVLSTALEKHRPVAAGFETVEGGMFLWLELAGGDDRAVAAECLALGVAVVPGSAFYPPGRGAGPALRLNFSNAPAEDLRRAAGIIGDVIAAV